MIYLAEGDPAGALGAVREVLDGTAPVLGYVTVVEADLLAGLAYRDLGDQRAANQAAEQALALAESDRLVLPFAMTGSRELLEALPRHETAHAALLADILDVLSGGDGGETPCRGSPGGRPPGANRGAESGRAPGAAISPDEPVSGRDRPRPVRLAEYRQHARPQHLRQARCP